MSKNEDLYREISRIRHFEEMILENFPKGIFSGTTHTYLGQEANAVGVLSQLIEGDIVFSNHRCHGHFLAYGGDMRSLFAELMGKETGVCGGRGGSQHLHWKNFYSNGIQGGIVPIATGAALGEQRKGAGNVVICFIGDGTFGEGVVYEAFNMASLWKAPILFVAENNHIAQTTPVEYALAGCISDRFNAFGIPTSEIDSSDVFDIEVAASEQFRKLRNKGGPRALILGTIRFGPHSKGDDTRPVEELQELKERRDPLKILGASIDPKARIRIEGEVTAEVATAFEMALTDPLPAVNEDMNGGASTSKWDLDESGIQFEKRSEGGSVLKSLNKALHNAVSSNERVIILGEDILDPYGGAFKVTQGLSSAFPNQVITTPISEAGIVGIATGMALRQMHPVVEIMFGDFLTLAADQIINHLTKFHWMYNSQVNVPIVIRTPMGGRRGYGPTHSQTLEKLFLGVPGLKVLAHTDLGEPGKLLLKAIWGEEPVLFVENKLLYLEKIKDSESLKEFDLIELNELNDFPIYLLRIKGAPSAAVTMVSYGYMAKLARESILKLAYDEEIFAELIVVTELSPFKLDVVVSSVIKTGKLVTVEEGTLTNGWGAEVIARISEAAGQALKSSLRIAAEDTPVPASSTLEEKALPGVDDIVRQVVGLDKVRAK